MRRGISWSLLAVVVVGALVFASRGERTDASPAARSIRIAKELRCPVCQGLSVADSPSSTAQAMMADIRRRIEAGDNDGEIRRAFVNRYGEWILLRPRESGFGAMVWFLPIAVLIVGAGGLALAFRRWKRVPPMHASEADHRLVEQAR